MATTTGARPAAITAFRNRAAAATRPSPRAANWDGDRLVVRMTAMEPSRLFADAAIRTKATSRERNSWKRRWASRALSVDMNQRGTLALGVYSYVSVS